MKKKVTRHRKTRGPTKKRQQGIPRKMAKVFPGQQLCSWPAEQGLTSSSSQKEGSLSLEAVLRRGHNASRKLRILEEKESTPEKNRSSTQQRKWNHCI